MTHILLVDDDKELTSLLNEMLVFEGFTVSEANDGEAGLSLVDKKVDLILLDVMMPKLNGINMLKKLREQWQTPVLMLTAKGDEIDRILGFELGADDYLPKPFSERELLARIKAILRRTKASTESNSSSDVIHYMDISLFPRKQEAYCSDVLLNITSTELALLHYFIQNPGEVLTKESLSLDVLGKRLSAFDRAIDMHMSNLRKKLPERDDGKPRIKTLRGRGYLMVEEG